MEIIVIVNLKYTPHNMIRLPSRMFYKSKIVKFMQSTNKPSLDLYFPFFFLFFSHHCLLLLFGFTPSFSWR